MPGIQRLKQLVAPVRAASRYAKKMVAPLRAASRYVKFSLTRRVPIWPHAAEPTLSDGTGQKPRKLVVLMHSGRLQPLYEKCFESLRRHCPDAHIELFTDLTESERRLLEPYGIHFHPIDPSRIPSETMALKIFSLATLDCGVGDQVVVSDLDVLYQNDIFSVFDANFDVFFTTRHYPYHFSINAGIWGFRANDRTKRFLKFFIKQIHCRTWRAFRDFQLRYEHDPFSLAWWVDQDFLCTVHEQLNNLPPDIRDVIFYDAGPRYNFCPSYDIYGENAVKELKEKLGNPQYVVLHLKAELKRVIDLEHLIGTK